MLHTNFSTVIKGFNHFEKKNDNNNNEETANAGKSKPPIQICSYIHMNIAFKRLVSCGEGGGGANTMNSPIHATVTAINICVFIYRLKSIL